MDLGRARGGVWDILSGTWEETGTRFVSQLYGVLGAFFSFSGNFLRLDCCHYYPHLALLDTSSDVFFFLVLVTLALLFINMTGWCWYPFSFA